MKKRIFLLPITLLGLLLFVTWGCEPTSEEFCEKFEVAAECEVPNICCPEGQPCYYEYGDHKFTCNGDDCSEAENQIMAVVCPDKKHVREEAVIKLRMYTKQLMEKVRVQSVCL